MPGTTDRTPDGASRPGRWQRLGWFVLLYAAGLAAALVIAYALKALIPGV
jgi:hypothetical protein